MGVSVFIENPRRGGVPGEGPRGREGVCSELGNLGGGGGLNFFFSGPKCPPSLISAENVFRETMHSGTADFPGKPQMLRRNR